MKYILLLLIITNINANDFKEQVKAIFDKHINDYKIYQQNIKIKKYEKEEKEKKDLFQLLEIPKD